MRYRFKFTGSTQVTCLLCQHAVTLPHEKYQGLRNVSVGCGGCGAQVHYYVKNKVAHVTGYAKRRGQWSFWYSTTNDNTRFVCVRKPRQDPEAALAPREEYTFSGLIPLDRFLSMKAFI